MTAHLSDAEARALGLTAPKARASGTTRKVSRSRATYHTRCHSCEERFLTLASETRHLEATGHHRYELVIDP